MSVFCEVSQKEISVNLQTKITGYLRYPYKSIHYLSYSVYLSEAQSPFCSQARERKRERFLQAGITEGN